MSEETKEEKRLEEWIYAGMRYTKNKKYYGWVKDKNNLNEISWWSEVLVSASVGNIYLMTCEGSSVYTKGQNMPKYIGRFKENPEILKEWAIADESARQQVSIKSMNTKASKEAPLEEYYADLAKASKKLNMTERCALIAKLSEIIMRA